MMRVLHLLFLFNMKIGWGTNEGAIIEVVAHRTAAQRNAIRRAYHEMYGEDLLKSFDKELTRDFEVHL